MTYLEDAPDEAWLEPTARYGRRNPDGSAMTRPQAIEAYGEPDRDGHITRFSDSSLYDEVCVMCGSTDRSPNFSRPCPIVPKAPAAQLSEAVEKVARAMVEVTARRTYGDNAGVAEVAWDNLTPYWRETWVERARAAIAAMPALIEAPRTDELAEARRLLKMWRDLVQEGGGVPRYTVLPGAALNTLVGWTDAALRKVQGNG